MLGTELPSFTLTPNDGTADGSAITVDPSVTAVNDAPVLAISGSVASFTEDGTAATGDVVITYTLTDEETTDTQTLTLSDTTNYSLDETNKQVKLTAAGVALLNSSGALPTFTLQTNDGTVDSALISATPSVTSVNDLPVITAGATFNFTEDSGASTDSVVASYALSDGDGDSITVTLSDTTNYGLDGTN